MCLLISLVFASEMVMLFFSPWIVNRQMNKSFDPNWTWEKWFRGEFLHCSQQDHKVKSLFKFGNSLVRISHYIFGLFTKIHPYSVRVRNPWERKWIRQKLWKSRWWAYSTFIQLLWINFRWNIWLSQKIGGPKFIFMWNSLFRATIISIFFAH